MPEVALYMTTVTGNVEIKKQQQKIIMILESKKIPFERYDISANSDFKDRMRKLANNPTALAPQLANGDDYCGNYEDFEAAVECDGLNEFLKI